MERSDNMPEEEPFVFSVFPMLNVTPEYEDNDSEASDTETRASLEEAESLRSESEYPGDGEDPLSQHQENQLNSLPKRSRANGFRMSLLRQPRWWLPALIILWYSLLSESLQPTREGPWYYLLDSCLCHWAFPELLLRWIPLVVVFFVLELYTALRHSTAPSTGTAVQSVTSCHAGSCASSSDICSSASSLRPSIY